MRVKRSSRQKQKTESTTFRNAYQDLTAKYNGYFNANLIIKESLKKLEEAHKDDFNAIIPVFEYEGGEKANSVHSQLDVAIKKASVDIKLHPNSKWVDDCYLIIGQSQYLKGNYTEALENLEYINKEFDNKQRIESFVARDKAGTDKNRSFPSVQGSGGVNVGGNKITTEDAKKALQKKREDEKADKARERKAEAKEREKSKKDKQKERASDRKETQKERDEVIKEKEKSNKEKAKERDALKKEREKEAKKRKKDRAKVKKMSPEKKKEWYAQEKIRKEREKEEKAAELEEKLLEEERATEEEAQRIADELEKEKEEAQAEIEEEIVEEVEPEQEEEPEEVKEDKPEKKKKDSKTSSARNTASKKKAKKGSSSMGHKLAKHESMIWVAKTFLAKEQYDDAKQILDKALETKKYPRKLKSKLYGNLVQYHLATEEYDQAYNAVDDAISVTRGKRKKARLYYIKAQLEQQKSNHSEAAIAYKKVTKSKAEFPLDFSARIQLGKTKLLAGEYNSESAQRYFNKMLKDEKNEEVQDQIYLALAEIEIANGNIDEAVAMLKGATQNESVSEDQKGQVFLKIAELFFEEEEFLTSSYYYDSAATSLSKKFPNYEEILERKTILADLAKHLETIQVEDSLQMIALMPEAQRNVFVDELIADLEEQARLKAEQAEKAKNQPIDTKDPIGNNAGKWYFYNPLAKNQGRNVFNAQWGGRPLQDDWRRNSQAIAFDDENQEVSSSATPDADVLIDLLGSGSLNRDVLINNLPLDSKSMQNSHKKITYALFEAGNIFKDKLLNENKAIETYNELLTRYPDCDYAVQTHYTLFLLESKNGNTASAEQHKNYVLRNDKKGIYSKLIDNPDYQTIMESQNLELVKYYEETYGLYLSGNYEEVMTRSENASTKFESNSLQAQFDLLTAFAIGQTQEKEKYIIALKNIVNGYPGDPVKTKAEEILSYIEKGSKTNANNNKLYKLDVKASHYYVVAFDGFVDGISQTVNNFTDYNNENNSLDNLNVTQMLLDPQNQILLVKTFKDGLKALEYYKKVKAQQATLLDKTGNVESTSFVISKKNFTKFFSTKDAATYFEFFDQYYLNKN